ncbi:MAG: DUF4403 family protein, partial [Moraxellaceae bacterium]
PSPMASGSQTMVLRVRFNPAGNARPEPGSCSITALDCLTRKAAQAVAVDYTAPVETVVTHQVYLRDLVLRLDGNRFVVTAQAEFAVNSRFNSPLAQFGVASCGVNEAMPRVEFALAGTLGWSPAGEVVINPEPWSLKWLRPCNITVFQINLETVLNLPGLREQVREAIHLALSDAFRQVSLRGSLARAWPELNAPREVQRGLWLLPQPERFAFVPPQGTGRQLVTGLAIQARPVLASGEKPVVTVPPVPRPERTLTGEGVHLALKGDIALSDASALLTAQLAGKPLKAGDRQVQIDHIRLYGYHNKAVIGLLLSQPVRAEIFLLGKPVFDVEKNEVRFEALEYSLGTQDFLVRTANWLLGSSFRSTLEQRARFRFDDDMAEALKEFRNLRHDIGNGLVLRGGVDRVRPLGLYFTPDRLQVQVLLDGRLALESAGK